MNVDNDSNELHVLIARLCARWLVYRVIADTATARHELALQVCVVMVLHVIGMSS
jgi:hypothetical protein